MSNIDINQLKEITTHLKRLEATILMAQTVTRDVADKLSIVGKELSEEVTKLDKILFPKDF